MLYSRFQLVIYFIYNNVYMLIPTSYFFFYTTHISDIIWYLSFSVWLTSFTMIISRSIHIDANGIVSFYVWVIFHCIYAPDLLHPFLCQGTFRLLPCFGNYKQCCNEHWGACIFSKYDFLQIYAQKWDCWVIW